MSKREPTDADVQGSYRMPSFEHARVADVMRTGTLTCLPSASLRAVARTMASHHVHSVVVTDPDEGGGRVWGLLSDLDLVDAARGGTIEDLTAGEVAASEVLTVTKDDALEHAAQLMAEHQVAHIIVVDAANGRPIGMLSTLDIAGSMAWGRA